MPRQGPLGEREDQLELGLESRGEHRLEEPAALLTRTSRVRRQQAAGRVFMSVLLGPGERWGTGALDLDAPGAAGGDLAAEISGLPLDAEQEQEAVPLARPDPVLEDPAGLLVLLCCIADPRWKRLQVGEGRDHC